MDGFAIANNRRNTYNGRDRRTYKRFPLSVDSSVVLKINNPSGIDRVLRGSLSDISDGGIGLKCDSLIPGQLQVGAKVDLVLGGGNSTKQKSSLSAIARWVNDDDKKAGFSFLNDHTINTNEYLLQNKLRADDIQHDTSLENSNESVLNVLLEVNKAFALLTGEDSKLLAYPGKSEIVAKNKAFLLKNSPIDKTFKDLIAISRSVKQAVHAITDNNLREQSIAKEKNKQFSKIERSKTFFRLMFNAIIHDINNINYVIEGFSDIIMDDIKAGKQADVSCIEEVVKASHRLIEIIRTAQSLYKNRFEVDPEEIDSKNLFSEMQSSRRDADLKDCVNFKLLPNSSIDTFVAYKDALMNALMQIVQNARRYLPKKGTINVNFDEIYSSSQRFIEITIEDEGGGIAEEDLGKIFNEKFSTKKNGGGLGLFISQNIIRSMGGHIGVENVVHKNGKRGAKFTIIFPDEEENLSQLN